MILHDMQCRFNSPTVNLYMSAADFLKFCRDPGKYLNAVPVELPEKSGEYGFPVGTAEDITLYFMHYGSFDEARKKWIERSARADMNNVFIMMSDKNGCTYDDLLAFDALPYEHKIVFTHRPYPEIKSAYYIRGFENEDEVGILSDDRPGFFKRRYLDEFDYVKWFNG